MFTHHPTVVSGFRRVLAAVSLCVLAVSPAFGQEKVSPETLPQGFVVIVTDANKQASASRPIYWASGKNSWNPGDNDYQLSPRSDGRWQIVFEGGELGENVEFKFTLGGWGSVETDPDGQDIPNRTFPDVDVESFKAGEKPVIELTVPRFRVGGEGHRIAPEYRPLEVTGTVRRLQVAGGAGSAAGQMRDLLVWLPPHYDQHASESYPVLYMMDGQNLYQKHEGVPAEWGMDETATSLIAGGEVRPFIVVGVPHGGASRMEEYMPGSSESGKSFYGRTPAGDDHIAWMAREVMPRVERAFRVKTGPGNTAIGGSSAGGLIALHAGLTRPDLFGMVLAESPALQLDAMDLDMVENAKASPRVPARVYIGMGGTEHLPGSGFYDTGTMRHTKAAKALEVALRNRSAVHLEIVTDAAHNEQAWADRLPVALRHLFPAP
jgi:predicted alpha/beta superfamily hydrolase